MKVLPKFEYKFDKVFAEVNEKLVYKIIVPHIGEVWIGKFKILDSETGKIEKSIERSFVCA